MDTELNFTKYGRKITVDEFTVTVKNYRGTPSHGTSVVLSFDVGDEKAAPFNERVIERIDEPDPPHKAPGGVQLRGAAIITGMILFVWGLVWIANEGVRIEHVGMVVVELCLATIAIPFHRLLASTDSQDEEIE